MKPLKRTNRFAWAACSGEHRARGHQNGINLLPSGSFSENEIKLVA